jgi:hypothetical protein
MNEKRRAIRMITIFAPYVIGLAMLIPLMNNAIVAGIRDEIELYLYVSLTDTQCKVFILAVPCLMSVVYFIFISRRNALGFLCVALMEAVLMAGTGYHTVAAPMPGEKKWAAIAEIEIRRGKGFPVPQQFKRNRIYPNHSNGGCVFKYHTDWGYDSTVLKSIQSLVRSQNADILTGPYLRLCSSRAVAEDATLAGCQTADDLVFVNYGPNKVSLRFKPIQSDCIGVLNFMYFPGWTVSSDGHPRRCSSVKSGLMAVELKQGDRDLQATFAPRYFYYPLAVSVFTLILLSAIWIRACVRRRTPG